MERFVVGFSLDTEAEYGSRADAKVTLLTIYNDEVSCFEGFESIKAACDNLRAHGITKFEIL